MSTIAEALAIANEHHEAGQLQSAERIYRHILASEPNQPDAWHLLGAIALQVGNHEAAIEYIGRAIGLKGTNAAYHSNLGVAFMNQGKLDEAVASFRRALQLKPDFAEVLNNLCVALKDEGKLDEAVDCGRRALQLKPDYAEAHYNLAIALRDQGKLDEAVDCYRRALQLKLDFAEIHHNLAIALRDQGKLDEAVDCCRRALQLKPDFAEAHKSLGMIWNLRGQFEQGWPEYEWRWKCKEFTPHIFPQPVWTGESLAGKAILLHAEQGFGDTIQFIRFASILKRQGATVILGCPNQLLQLLRGFPGVDLLIGENDVLPAFDVHAPLLSLPGILKTTIETIPASIPYFLAKPALLEQWRDRLNKFEGFKIGISWQGNPFFRDDRLRSIPLRCFAHLAEIPGVHLIGLQRGFGIEQVEELRDLFPVADLGNELDRESGPFMDTAAVMKNLDLVITADTAVAHLAGALGVPTWVALSIAPNWRWMLGRSDSPWYPTLRLFRQKELGNWPAVFEEMKEALLQRLQSARMQGDN